MGNEMYGGPLARRGAPHPRGSRAQQPIRLHNRRALGRSVGKPAFHVGTGRMAPTRAARDFYATCAPPTSDKMLMAAG
jgi:hypothetical protein